MTVLASLKKSPPEFVYFINIRYYASDINKV